MHIALEIANRQGIANHHRCRQAAIAQIVLAPASSAIDRIGRPESVIGVGHIERVGGGRQPGVRREFTPPEHRAAVDIDGRQVAVEAGDEDLIANHHRVGVDIGDALEFRAAGGGRDRRLPDRRPVFGIEIDQTTVGDADDDPIGADSRSAAATQGQDRCLIPEAPALAAVAEIQSVDSVIDGVDDDQIAADARHREHLAAELGAPALTAIAGREQEHLAIRGADRELLASDIGAAAERQAPLVALPNEAPVGGIECDHSAAVVGGIDPIAGNRRAQTEGTPILALADARRPQRADPDRLWRRLRQLGGRARILVAPEADPAEAAAPLQQDAAAEREQESATLWARESRAVHDAQEGLSVAAGRSWSLSSIRRERPAPPAIAAA